MTIPQAAFALQNFLLLLAGLLFALVGEGDDVSRNLAIGCVIVSCVGHCAIGILLIIDANTAEHEARADAAEQERLLKVQPTMPS